MIDINDAIRKSKNTIAVRVFNILGARKVFDHLKYNYAFDLIESEKRQNGTVLSDFGAAPLALGQLSRGVSLRNMTEAYNVFPNNGILSSGRSYTAVYNRNGETVISKELSNRRIYSEDTVQIMNQLLSNVVFDGTARQIRLKEYVDVAGKTGTSGDDRDRLFIGYTPYFTGGIWCGFEKKDKQVGFNSPNHLEIWDQVMKKIHDKLIFSDYDESLESFNTNKIIVAPYCSYSGLKPTELCELSEESIIKYGYFKTDLVPESECDYH